MPRAGRELEILVADLEELLSGSSLQVKSPDYIYNYLTEKKEEIDVTVRGKLGSHEILILFQCRDREGPEESTWIGELTTQKEGTKANTLIALSSGDFTEPSKKLAEKKGIELRNIKTYKPNEVISWLSTFKVQIIQNTHQIFGAHFLVVPHPIWGAPSKLDNLKPADKILKYTKDGKTLSLDNLFDNANIQNNNAMFNNVEINAPPIKAYFIINIEQADPKEKMVVKIKGKNYHVKSVSLDILLSKNRREIPVTEIKRYQCGEKILGEVGVFKGKFSSDKDIEFKILSDSEKKKGTRIMFSFTKRKES